MAGECISYEVAVGQLLANDFAGVEERLRVNVRTSPIHALLFAQIAFARAVLSLSPADAEDALARCWDADALANEAGEGGGRGGMMSALFGTAGGQDDTDLQANLERQLVKADAHLMGAVMQLLLGRYLRAGLNFRSGWNLYHDAADTLARVPEVVPPRLKCVIDFGIGMFNLVVSLLPASYIRIAEYVGFAGNRADAKSLLSRSYQSDEVWSPFSALLLLYFYTQLAPNLGILHQGDAADVEGILASPAAQRHQNSALFLWMEGMAARLYRRAPEVAAATLSRASEAAATLPALQHMVLNDMAWMQLDSLRWGKAADAFNRLLDVYASGTASASAVADPYAAVYAYEAGLCHALAGNTAAAAGLLERVPVLLESAGGRAKTAAWGAERYVLHMSRRLRRRGNVDLGDVRSAVLELLVLWDRADSLSPQLALDALQLLQLLPASDPSGSTLTHHTHHTHMLVRACLVAACAGAAATEEEAAERRGEAAALLDALIAASSPLEAVLLPVPDEEEEEDSRHMYVFARYYRAKLLLKGPSTSGKEALTAEKAADIAKAKLLVTEACRAEAKQVHMAVMLDFKLHALAEN